MLRRWVLLCTLAALVTPAASASAARPETAFTLAFSGHVDYHTDGTVHLTAPPTSAAVVVCDATGVIDGQVVNPPDPLTNSVGNCDFSLHGAASVGSSSGAQSLVDGWCLESGDTTAVVPGERDELRIHGDDDTTGYPMTLRWNSNGVTTGFVGDGVVPIEGAVTVGGKTLPAHGAIAVQALSGGDRCGSWEIRSGTLTVG